MPTRFLSVLAAAAAFVLSAAELPPGVKFAPDGSFRIGDAGFFIQSYSPVWSITDNRNWGERRTDVSPGRLAVSGIMKNGSGSAAVTETLTAAGRESFRLDFRARFTEPATVNALHGAFTLPAREMAVTVDGSPLMLPGEFGELTLLRKPDAKQLRFTAAGGYEITVAGSPLKLTIQDNRAFGNDTFSFRFGAAPDSGRMREAVLRLDLRVGSPVIRKLDLSKVVNRAFSDDRAGDGKGGWTDQGPDNDLRKLKSGTITLDSLEFDVPDPAENGGRGAIVLAGAERGFAPGAVALPLPPNDAGAVNLLHGSAWTPEHGRPLGTIVAEYADSSAVRIPVLARIDCGNWWNPVRGDNAAIAWSADNPDSQIGLYASSFALPKPGPRSLRFETAAPGAAWMIVGAALSDRPVRFAPAGGRPVEIREGREWKPLAYRRTVTPGGALDFSFLADAPAGKYGFIKASPQGTFTFEKAPEKRIRLYGANLCLSANYLDKAEVDKLADYFVYCGYNSVRIHHHDTLLLDPDAPDSLTLSPEQLDKLDYLLFRMKEKGVYVTTDLYTNRAFRPGDGIPECTFYDQRQLRILLPFSRGAMQSWKEFARRWMGHRNPYTGLTWAEDPALYCVNLVNEEVLSDHWSRSADGTKLYEAAFRQYCRERRLPESAPANGNPVFRRFLHEIQEKVISEQIRFVKEELGMKAVVTSLNYLCDIPLTLLRRRFDAVDNHMYFDHPRFTEKNWSLPITYHQGAAINRMAVLPRDLMACRIPGKPFMITEFNYCNPNIYRAEGGPLIGAYAALQDWDALYRFAWSHAEGSIRKLDPAYGFDAANDPMAQLSDRIAIAMFRRGDVESAKVTYAYTVPEECFERNLTGAFPSRFLNLGLITGVGSLPQDGPAGNAVRLSPGAAAAPELLKERGIAELWRTANEKRIAVSATGQLRLDAKANSFTVASPRTESVTLNGGSLAAGTLRVRDATCFQTVAAISLDGKPLARSGSILVIHLTNTVNSGVSFSNDSKTLLTKSGKLPLLVFRGSATIELATETPFDVVALDCDGSPRGSAGGTFKNGLFRFRADTALFPGGTLAYHLTR
ncbi:MAG: hypothetical protein HPZ91_05240 [Lentisphaeria bacterium]|nr:hypothetical protein [Lentisphaeria bacterium]